MSRCDILGGGVPLSARQHALSSTKIKEEKNEKKKNNERIILLRCHNLYTCKIHQKLCAKRLFSQDYSFDCRGSLKVYNYFPITLNRRKTLPFGVTQARTDTACMHQRLKTTETRFGAESECDVKNIACGIDSEERPDVQRCWEKLVGHLFTDRPSGEAALKLATRQCGPRED